MQGKKEELGVLRRINQPVETLPTTISKGRWWENFTLWRQQMWGLLKLSEQKRSNRVLLSISDIKSEACSSDKVGLMSLKWGNQRDCRWGLDDECSLAPPLASSQPSGARLNPFTLTARQSLVPAPSGPDAPSPPLISCSKWLDWCYISKYIYVCVCVRVCGLNWDFRASVVILVLQSLALFLWVRWRASGTKAFLFGKNTCVFKTAWLFFLMVIRPGSNHGCGLFKIAHRPWIIRLNATAVPLICCSVISPMNPPRGL